MPFSAFLRIFPLDFRNDLSKYIYTQINLLIILLLLFIVFPVFIISRQTKESRQRVWHIPSEKAQKVQEKLQIFLYQKSRKGGDVITKIYQDKFITSEFSLLIHFLFPCELQFYQLQKSFHTISLAEHIIIITLYVANILCHAKRLFVSSTTAKESVIKKQEILKGKNFRYNSIIFQDKPLATKEAKLYWNFV